MSVQYLSDSLKAEFLSFCKGFLPVYHEVVGFEVAGIIGQDAVFRIRCRDTYYGKVPFPLVYYVSYQDASGFYELTRIAKGDSADLLASAARRYRRHQLRVQKELKNG